MKRLAGLLTYIKRWPPSAPYVFLLCASAVLAFLGYDYQRSLVPFTIVFDGKPWSARTHQQTVGGALLDAGLEVAPGDWVEPSQSRPVTPNMTVTVEAATPVVVEADGRLVEWRTHKLTSVDVLAEVGVILNQYDEVWVGGSPVLTAAALPAAEGTGLNWRKPAPWERPAPQPIRLIVKRAAVLYVDTDGLPSTLYTTATTIGEALREHDVILFLGDRVSPGLGTRVSAGLRVYIQRSKAVELMVDGRSARTRTRGKTVADVLAQQSVTLVGKDIVEPPESTPVRDGMGIHVSRVSDAALVEQDSVPFETVWKPATDMEIDQQRVETEGKEGLTKRRIEVVYRDGQEVSRELQDEWIESEPATKIIAYGTRIVPKELDTDAGPLTYWRKVRMLATSYTAASSGKDASHPQYGITRSGLPVERGVVALDAKVVPLGGKVYVPGYGMAVVGDTGGGIQGRRIDLGYSEDDLVMWYRWVDVYVVGLAPVSNDIRWVLPNWPRERR